MRPLHHVGILLCFVAAAYSAYRVSHSIHVARERLEVLTQEIGNEEDRIAVLRVEWTYLNRGDRLLSLVDRFHDQLLLEPVAPHQITLATEVFRNSEIAAASTDEGAVIALVGDLD